MNNTPILNNSAGEKQRLPSGIEAALNAFQIDDDNLLPAIVSQYDRAKNIVTVTPLITWVMTDGSTKKRPEIEGIPVLSIGAGNFHVSFPIKNGDLGWIFAVDRDIGVFLQSLQESAPNSGRMHSFSSALFIPDVFRKYTISAEDADRMVIQHTSSNSRIAIGDSIIKMTTPKVVLDTPTTEITGDVTIAKTLKVTGKTTMADDATVMGISVIGHGHISSAPGVRTQNGMIT